VLAAADYDGGAFDLPKCMSGDSKVVASGGSACKTGDALGVDLFCGAGGMSLGATWAGVEVALAIEKDPNAARTYQHNHATTRVFVEDIRRIEAINLKHGGRKRILFGGPPCQGFSTSNRRTRSKDNSNNWLFLEFVRFADLWNPEWIVLENVKGITDTEKGLFLDLIVAEFEKRNYAVSWWVLNASQFGVPQKRDRLFVIGSRTGGIPKKPSPPSDSTTVSVRSALSDLPGLKNGASVNFLPYRGTADSPYAQMMREQMTMSANHLVTNSAPHIIERYRHVPQGGNWTDIPQKLMDNYSDRNRCHTGIYRRLKPDEPSVVIGNYRKNMLIHPHEDRGLSVREAARLQSFPDWYEFKGSIGFQQQQVGDSVPPLLAKAVFESLMSET